MSRGSLRLEWHNHGTELLDLTRDLCGQSELTDVTLACAGGVTFSAHRIVLAGASYYFRSLFQGMPGWKHPVVFLKDVSSTEMEYFLQFIYYGEVSVAANELDNLVKVAKELGIKGLDAVAEPAPTETSSSKVAPSKRKFIKLGNDSSSGAASKKLKIKEELGETSFHPNDFYVDESEESRQDNLEEEFEFDDYTGFSNNDDSNSNHEIKMSTSEAVPEKKKEKVIEGYTGEEDGDNVIEVLETQRGFPMIALNGFCYMISNRRAHSISWRCTLRSCKGRLLSDVHFLQGEIACGHNHKPDYGYIEKMKVLTKMKEISRTSEMSPPDIIESVLETVPEEVRSKLPKRDSLIKILTRHKKTDSANPDPSGSGNSFSVGHLSDESNLT